MATVIAAAFVMIYALGIIHGSMLERGDPKEPWMRSGD